MLDLLYSTPVPPHRLPAEMQRVGDALKDLMPGADRLSALFARMAKDSMEAHEGELLTLTEAAKEWGGSYEGVRRKVKDDSSLNAGTPGAPLIRRSDLARLGAPRGARGPYGPRKSKAKNDADTPSERSSPSEPSVANAADESRANIASDHAPVTHQDPGPAPIPVDAHEVERGDSAPVIDERDARSTDTSAPAKRSNSGSRKAGKKKLSKPSPKSRFNELLALAARG